MGQLIQRAGARRALVVVLVAIGFAFAGREARAQLNMTLSGTPGSPVVTASFSGSATATSAFGGGITAIAWEFTPTAYNPFPPQITGLNFGVFNFTSGSATITINGTTHNMAGVFLQDSSNSPEAGKERYGTTGFSYGPVTVGQPFQWAGTATFDLSSKGLTFSDLTPGTTGTFGSDLFGLPGSLTIVPEPSSLALLLGCGLALNRRFRHRIRAAR